MEDCVLKKTLTAARAQELLDVAAAPERRKDVTKRKRILEMTTEEMCRELLVDPLTGLGNRRAWEEADKGTVLASLDMDALKWVNDTMGHTSGDKMLAAMGEALNDVMPGQAFRVSGDEFLAHFEGQGEANLLLAKAADLLGAATVSVRLPDGTVITKTVVGYSYGTGTNLEDAEAGLQRHKAERERTGLRTSRGREPSGVVRAAPEGQQAGERKDATPVAPAVLLAHQLRDYILGGRAGSPGAADLRIWDPAKALAYLEESPLGPSESACRRARS